MPKSASIIVACAENRTIGRDGRLPWRIAEDWDFLRRQTAGQIVILGRVSFGAWKSLLDAGRRAIVVTRDDTLAGERVQVARSLGAALALAEDLPGEIYIAGGERIFAEAIARPEVTRLYLTLVHAEPAGDRHFPEWRTAFPRIVSERHGADAQYRYTFFTLER